MRSAALIKINSPDGDAAHRCPFVGRLLSWFVVGFIGVVAGAVPAGHAATLRVATMNLDHDFPAHQKVDFRLDILAKEIREKSIDVVGLQEGYGYAPSKENTVEALAKKLGYYYVFSKLTGPGKFFGLGFLTGNGIISRYPITESSSIRLDGPSVLRKAFENRSALRARIETPSGPIQVFDTHLAGRPHRSHTLQARSLAKWIQQFPMNTPSFLTGDFNAEDHEEGMVELETVYHMIDAEKEANPLHLHPTSCREIFQGSHNPLGHCPKGRLMNRRVDYVFVVPSVQGSGRVVSTEPLALEGQADPRDGKEVYVSDHVGVATVVEW